MCIVYIHNNPYKLWYQSTNHPSHIDSLDHDLVLKQPPWPLGIPFFSHEPPIFWPHKPRSPRFSSAVASSDTPNRRWCRHLQRTRSERVHLRPRKAKDVVICMYSMCIYVYIYIQYTYIYIYICVYYIYICGHPPTTHRNAVFTGICTIKSGIYSIKSYKISSFLVQFVFLQDHIPKKRQQNCWST